MSGRFSLDVEERRLPAGYAASVLLNVGSGPGTVVFAHPVAGHPHVDVPLALTVGGCAAVVLAVSLAVPGRRARPGRQDRPATSWEGRLSNAQVVGRTIALLLLLTAIAAGRLGLNSELENLAPALVIGLAMPLLAAAALLLGPVWRWVDPWDAVSRVISGAERESRPTTVWPATVVALPLVWYVGVYLDALSPRALGAALAVYTIVTVGGCMAFGRTRWLASAEPIGITLTWIALTPGRRLADWTPPRGAEVLLGVVTGGLLFGLVRRAEVWTELTTGVSLTRYSVYTSLGLVAACAVFAGFLTLMGKAADLVGTRPGVAKAAVPLVAGIVVAVALERNRLFTSAQLLPGLLGDPFGFGWDLFGPAVDGLDAELVPAGSLLILQLGIVVLTALVSAVVAVLRVQDRVRRLPIGITSLYLTAASVAAVAIH